jgi:filamentous hemagglutinin family protein
MNKTYNLVWSAVRGAYIATQECAKSKGKPSSTRKGLGATGLVLGLMGALGGASYAVAAPPTPAVPAPNALPTGGQVAAGSASIAQSASRMDVTQTSPKAVLNWQTFNIGSAAQVNFAQPSASAVALNRVLSSDPSAIYGKLSANGQVFLLNPNGVLFGAGARVDVGGLVASTMKLDDADFMASNYKFSGGSGSVINQGNLTAAQGGYIALLSPEVRNEGVISASLGTVVLGGAEAVTLSHDGSGLSYAVDKGAVQALVENKGLVQADGGQVLLSARAANELASAVINNSGTIEAKGLSKVGGRIVLEADHALIHTGTLTAPSITANTKNLIDAGTWDASAASNGTVNGGSITVSASGSVEQVSAAQMKVGSASGNAGEIRVTAGEGVYLSGNFDASSTGGHGGEIAITAPDVTLAGAQLHADGTTGGGRIRIGGGWQGLDTDLANANTTRINASTTLTANATQQGTGGTVVVWSEQETNFAGHIEAKGGAQGGDGGQVEISSHGNLGFGGTVETPALTRKISPLLRSARQPTA